MEIISDGKRLVSKFKILINDCEKMSILSAWGTTSNPLFEDIEKNRNKFYKVVIGLKFFQTDPKLIKAFNKTRTVRFVKNDTSGVFHPKVYLFETKQTWHLFVGSPNFTKSGFGNNFEVVAYAKGENFKSETYLEIKDVISRAWKESSKMTNKEIKNYEKTHQLQKSKLSSLSGIYGKSSKKKAKPIYTIPILNLSWSEFVKKIINTEEEWKINGRIELLNHCRGYFNTSGNLLSMNKNERQEIGGLGSNQDLIFGSFGTMRARGYFRSYINNITETPLLSEALDEIPLNGNITKSHYMNFVNKFQKVFSESMELAGASRLLTIKRPDVFVNLNGKNKKGLCNSFEISKNISYEEYWDSIIKRIHDSKWWNNPKPKNNLEREIADKRAAFLDSIYYEG